MSLKNYHSSNQNGALKKILTSACPELTVFGLTLSDQPSAGGGQDIPLSSTKTHKALKCSQAMWPLMATHMEESNSHTNASWLAQVEGLCL